MHIIVCIQDHFIDRDYCGNEMSKYEFLHLKIIKKNVKKSEKHFPSWKLYYNLCLELVWHYLPFYMTTITIRKMNIYYFTIVVNSNENLNNPLTKICMWIKLKLRINIYLQNVFVALGRSSDNLHEYTLFWARAHLLILINMWP